MPRLTFNRRRGESVMIGADVRVTVLHTGRARAKIMIEAPADIGIVRSELVDPNHGRTDTINEQEISNHGKPNAGERTH